MTNLRAFSLVISIALPFGWSAGCAPTQRTSDIIATAAVEPEACDPGADCGDGTTCRPTCAFDGADEPTASCNFGGSLCQPSAEANELCWYDSDCATGLSCVGADADHHVTGTCQDTTTVAHPPPKGPGSSSSSQTNSEPSHMPPKGPGSGASAS